MEQILLDWLVCPICKGKLSYDDDNQELICKFDKLAYPIRQDIPVMLADQARRITDDDKELK